MTDTLSFPYISLEQLGAWTPSLSPEERMVRDSTRRWVSERWMPDIAAHFEAATFPLEVAEELGLLGILGASLTGYGCAGISNVAYGLAMNELEYGDSGLRSFASVQSSLVMYAIHCFGSEAQKQRWLPALASAEAIGCFGLTEPDAGSDPAAMKSRARRDGTDWVLSGEKLWITNSPVAHLMVVWARTDEPKRPVRGFLLERGTPGLTTPTIHHKMSMRASLTGGIAMDDVRLPAEAILDGSTGLGSALACLNNARYSVAWGVMGAARFCLDTAIAYARERRSFGMALGAKQLVQSKIADLASQVVIGELLALHSGRLKDLAQLGTYQISLAKRNNCAVALAVARETRALLGANGITLDYHVIRHALNLESCYTYEGTHEVHGLIIGRGLTGESAF